MPLHYKGYSQEVDRCDPSSLLSTGEATSGVMGPAVGSLLRTYVHTGQSLVMVKDWNISYMNELCLFRLRKRGLGCITILHQWQVFISGVQWKSKRQWALTEKCLNMCSGLTLASYQTPT